MKTKTILRVGEIAFGLLFLGMAAGGLNVFAESIANGKPKEAVTSILIAAFFAWGCLGALTSLNKNDL